MRKKDLVNEYIGIIAIVVVIILATIGVYLYIHHQHQNGPQEISNTTISSLESAHGNNTNRA